MQFRKVIMLSAVFMLISCAGGTSTAEAEPTQAPSLPSTATITENSGLTRVWAVDDGEKVKRGDLSHPLADSRENTVWDGEGVSIFGARNEIVAFQLILEAGASGAEDIDVYISDLSNGSFSISNSKAGSANPFDYLGKNIELFTEHYIEISDPSRGGSSWSQSARPSSSYLGWVPDALIPLSAPPELGGSPFDIHANTNQGVWVDLWIPRNAPQGTYTGEIQISSGGGISHLIPIELVVLNFTLPDETHFPNMFAIEPGDIARRHGVKFDTDEFYEILTSYYQMAHRHRFDLVQSVRNLSQMRRYHQHYLSGSFYTDRFGYEGPGEGIGNQIFSIGLYGGMPMEYGEASPNWTQEDWWEGSDLWATWFNQNFPDVSIHKYLLPDEPRTSSDLRTIQAQADWSHNNLGIGGTIPTFVTQWIDPDYQGYVDIWSTSANHALLRNHPGTDPQDVENEKDAGKEWGVYNGYRPATGSTLLDTDAIDFRVIPWIGWKYDLDHYFYWMTTYWTDWQHDAARWNIFTNPRTATVQRNGSGTFFYPGQDHVYSEENRGLPGPLSSIRMKNWRRGMQDYEYLWLAQRLELGSEVERIVDQVVPAALWDADPNKSVAWPVRGNGFEAYRQELAELISATVTEAQNSFGGSSISFVDVEEDHPYRSYIGTLYQLGYMGGCDSDRLLFCPERPLTRAEGAVLFGRVVFGPDASPDQPDDENFFDLTSSGGMSWATPWAVQLWRGGFLNPCLIESSKFCPDSPLTRLDSVLITLRWIYGQDHVPPEAKGLFADISIHWWGASWMEQAYTMGILGYCKNDGLMRSCPYESLSRAEAAAMVVRLLGTDLP
jgi:hypothetical protein